MAKHNIMDCRSKKWRELAASALALSRIVAEEEVDWENYDHFEQYFEAVLKELTLCPDCGAPLAPDDADDDGMIECRGCKS